MTSSIHVPASQGVRMNSKVVLALKMPRHRNASSRHVPKSINYQECLLLQAQFTSLTEQSLLSVSMAADTKTRDAVDALLNYDVSDIDDDPFRELDTTKHDPTNRPNSTKRKATGTDNKENGDILGLDEEVKIVKKRKPVAKLDEARLLSQPGIPKLRSLARSKSLASKLRLKGKGHEYSDAAKLLSYYQLWLDNLYPRAKFADGLQLVEKVGHGKRMQVMRREWIDEGKPGYGRGEDDRRTIEDVEKRNDKDSLADGGGEQHGVKTQEAGPKKNPRASVFGDFDEGDDDDDDMFFTDSKPGTTVPNNDLEEPDEDELDMLLAEQTASKDSEPQHPQPDANEDEEDDLDALLAAQPPRVSRGEEPKQQKQRSPGLSEDDLDALLAEHEVLPLRQSDSVHPDRSHLVSDEDEDPLEALLAEQAGRPQ